MRLGTQTKARVSYVVPGAEASVPDWLVTRVLADSQSAAQHYVISLSVTHHNMMSAIRDGSRVDAFLLILGLGVGAFSCADAPPGVPFLPPFTLTPEGGQLSFLGGNVVITATAGALEDTTTFTVVTAAPTAPTIVGSSVTVTTNPVVTTFASPITIDFATQPTLLPAGVNETELGVYRFNANWTLVAGSAVNTTTHRLTAPVAGPGTYGVLGAPVDTVVVTPPSTSVAVGASVALSATPRDAAGGALPNRAVSFTSGATGTATVNGSGVVTGVAEGMATITASSEGNSTNVTVTVTAASNDPAFADDFETGDFNHTANNFAWKSPDGNDAIAGVGANGSFTRNSGTWSGSQVGLIIYLQSVAGNQNGDAGVMGPFTVTSNNATTLFFTGDATGAVQTRTRRAFITNTLARSGTRSIKFIYGPDLQEADSRSQIGFNLPMPGVSELWLEYYLFIPANYAHRTQTSTTNNKFAGIFGRDRTADPSRMLFDFETVDNGSGGSSMFAQSVFSSGNIASGAVRAHGDPGFTGANMIAAPGSPAVLGAWNQMRLHFRSESAAFAADGQMQLWINGTKVFEATGRSFGYPAAAGSAWFGTFPALVDNGYLLGAANSGFTELTIFHIDDAKFYLSNPGW
jgi:hypothetical protein